MVILVSDIDRGFPVVSWTLENRPAEDPSEEVMVKSGWVTRTSSPENLPLGLIGTRLARPCLIALLLGFSGCGFWADAVRASEMWRGLVVAPENRCSPYNSDDYKYPQSVELQIIKEMGGSIYGPYTGWYFSSRKQTDIEHIVARSEGHDSGLCAEDFATKAAFSRDLLNLTLAAPEVNRCRRKAKCEHDAAEWMPEKNQCWFAGRIVEVRRKYRLTIDRSEADALERVLSRCDSTEMEFYGTTSPPSPSPDDKVSTPEEALRRWDDNRNGRITCKEARRHGIAPVPRGHPAYAFMRDGDGDGMVCE